MESTTFVTHHQGSGLNCSAATVKEAIDSPYSPHLGLCHQPFPVISRLHLTASLYLLHHLQHFWSITLPHYHLLCLHLNRHPSSHPLPNHPSCQPTLESTFASFLLHFF